jgi:hypothetical protein
MRAPIRNSLVTRAILVFSICFSGAAIFLAGCGRSTSDSSATSSPTPGAGATAASAMLRAEPNPVPPGDGTGTTTISWQTGDGTPGEVYVVTTPEEKLFARGSAGSSVAPWIGNGSTQFRLYNQDHSKVLAQLTVTRPSESTSTTPVSSANP